MSFILIPCSSILPRFHCFRADSSLFLSLPPLAHPVYFFSLWLDVSVCVCVFVAHLECWASVPVLMQLLWLCTASWRCARHWPQTERGWSPELLSYVHLQKHKTERISPKFYLYVWINSVKYFVVYIHRWINLALININSLRFRFI